MPATLDVSDLMPASEAAYELAAAELLAPPPAPEPYEWVARTLTMPQGGPWLRRRGDLFAKWHRVHAARITGQPMDGDPWAHRCEQLYLVLSSQIAKTMTLLAMLTYGTRWRPAKSALIMARDKDLIDTKDSRLRPMLEHTPCLDALLPAGIDARTQALSGDLWQIGAAILLWRKASAAGDLASQDIVRAYCDEIGRWPIDVEGEGDPLLLTLARQRTYPHDRILVGATTPKGVDGHAWSRLCMGSHERPLALCERCGAAHQLDHRCIRLADLRTKTEDAERALEDVHPDEILADHLGRWACPWCGSLHDDSAVRRLVLECARAQRWVPGDYLLNEDYPGGHWRPRADLTTTGRLLRYDPPETIIRSAWANALYSVDVTATGFAAAKAHQWIRGSEAKKRAWINNEACEPKIPVVTTVNTTDITAKTAGAYRTGNCPETTDLCILVADQQGNTYETTWFPWVRVHVKRGGESWRVDMGKTVTGPAGWADLEQLADTLYPNGSEQRAADYVVVDSANGNMRQHLYDWANLDPARRLLVRGDRYLKPDEKWLPVHATSTGKKKTSRPAAVREWRIHPHLWRTRAFDRFTRRPWEPTWHMPEDAPTWYTRSLTSEYADTVDRRTKDGWDQVVVWQPRMTPNPEGEPIPRRDTHWFACEAYAAAIIDILGFGDKPPPDTTGEDRGGLPGDPIDDDYLVDDLVSDDETWGEW